MSASGDNFQLPLFDGDVPSSIGHASVEEVAASSILTRASGFMRDYDFTLNPYSGCSFGCTYCYAAFFARDTQLRDDWGYWVRVKSNAVALLRRMRTPLRGKSIYMSSVTDPYQPIEKKLELVRSLLQELIEHQPRLVIQTRSPLLERDIDLFRQFDKIRINMTITTDSESVRQAFEPMCPSNSRRLTAIRAVSEAGLETAITMTPLLPVEDIESFAQQLRETGANGFVVQPFHCERGKFVRGTRDAAMAITQQMNWTGEKYRAAVDVLRSYLPSLIEGQEGFVPV